MAPSDPTFSNIHLVITKVLEKSRVTLMLGIDWSHILKEGHTYLSKPFV